MQEQLEEEEAAKTALVLRSVREAEERMVRSGGGGSPRPVSQNGYLSSRSGCQYRWHVLMNCDHNQPFCLTFASAATTACVRACVRACVTVISTGYHSRGIQL